MIKKITALALALAAPNLFAQGIDKVFQAHSPDGSAYWVVACLQQDQCLEDAYQWCKGPYTPLDGNRINTSGFRFRCNKEPTPPK
jgi:hypothetical protein